MGTSTRSGLRADAARNRELLLAAAVRAFTAESRGGPATTLDGIAKDAGVGIGTLYRHFPNRDSWSRRSTATSSTGSAPRPNSCAPSCPRTRHCGPGWTASSTT